jgi:DNA-binding transcriptional LysR family regulator
MEVVGGFFLAGPLGELAKEIFGIVVELVTDRQLTSMAKREADIFVSFLPPPEQRLAVKKLGSVRLALYASSGYLASRDVPTTGAELDAHTFIDYVEDLATSQSVH